MAEIVSINIKQQKGHDKKDPIAQAVRCRSTASKGTCTRATGTRRSARWRRRAWTKCRPRASRFPPAILQRTSPRGAGIVHAAGWHAADAGRVPGGSDADRQGVPPPLRDLQKRWACASCRPRASLSRCSKAGRFTPAMRLKSSTRLNRRKRIGIDLCHAQVPLRFLRFGTQRHLREPQNGGEGGMAEVFYTG